MRRRLILLLILLISVCAISHVSAADYADIASDASTNIDDLFADQIDETLDSADDYQQEHVSENEPETGNVFEINSQDSNFSDIQGVIDNANAGDTIKLNGTFTYESSDKEIIINKTLNIVGVGDGANFKKGLANFKSFQFFKIESSASNVVLDNLIFNNANNKGAILWNGDNGLITNCQFNGNTVKGDGLGGAINLNANNCNITDCTFSNNHAEVMGGAIFIAGENNIISNSQFNENDAQVSSVDDTLTGGGAIYSNCERLTVDNCTFKRNKVANGNGGAIVVNGKDSKIINCKFEENSALNSTNTTPMAGGGAVYSDADNLQIENSNFYKNEALTSNGGAVYLNKPNTIKNSKFEKNLALNGNDLDCNQYSSIEYNNFVLEYDENIADSIKGLTEDNLKNNKNNFTFNKVASKVTFISTGMIFEYGASGSISITVDGGTVSLNNIKVLNHPEAKITLVKNVLTISNLAVGKYTLRVTTTPDERHNAVNSDLTVTVKKATAVIKAEKLTVALKSGSKWTVKIVDSRNNKPIANMQVTLKVYTGKKYKTVNVKTNSRGEVSYQTKKLSKGTHKVIVSASHAGYVFNTLKSSITVVKQKALKFKVIHKEDAKGGSIRSFVVLNKKTKKGINGIKIKVLIYTGKKYKSYILKTKKQGKYNGGFGFATNDFSAGKHKVVLKPVSIKYKGSFKTSIKIKKSAAKGPKFFRRV